MAAMMKDEQLDIAALRATRRRLTHGRGGQCACADAAAERQMS